MSTKCLFLFVLLSLPIFVKAQINWGDYSQSFPSEVQQKKDALGIILAIRKENNSYWSVREKSDYYFKLLADSSFIKVRSKELIARTTFDTSSAHFFLHAVNKLNAHLYEFRILEYPSNKIVEPWQSITKFTDSTLIKQSGFPEMAYLGGYKAGFGKMLIADVRKKNQTTILATSMISWESIYPAVSSVHTSKDLGVFLQKLQFPWSNTAEGQTMFQPINNLKLSPDNNNLVFVLNAEITSKYQIQYKLLLDNQIVTDWHDNEYNNSFIWLKDFSPGLYRIKMRYAIQPSNISEYTFEVEPAWYQTIWFKLATIIAGLALFGFCIFAYLLFQQRQKTRNEVAKKQKLQLELKALYAQLNPHFLFNCLSSIQGLINQQDFRGANEYLTDFAQLIRGLLTNSAKEETPLQQELQTLEMYLKLEKLRFGFSYNIGIDMSIDLSAISIPSLLWQPLVENAVKHGVATLEASGRINIFINKVDDSLVIVIKDNGKGFNALKLQSGLGLRLTQERIERLNELQNGQPIELTFNSNFEHGTEIILTFTHWFL